MLSTLANILTGGALGAWQEYLKARNSDRERDARLRAISASSDALFGVVRLAFAFPFIVYVWKLVLWDKIICAGQCRTDPLGPELASLMGVVIAGYFIQSTVKQFFAGR